jgi:methyltransferase family protein
MSPDEQDRIVAERSQPRHSDFGFVDFPRLPVVDGLISAAEQRYLYWLTSSMYSEEGAVVELGSWFGRSAMALGAGLRDSGRTSTLHCFDRFRWNPKFSDSVTVADVKALPDGADFMPFFQANVSQVYAHVRATKTTIDELEWRDLPVELLFIDAPKTFADLTRTLFVFGPYLTVGRSLVILQDFFFTPAYPISMTVAAMGDGARLVHTVTGTSTAAFVLDSPLPTRGVPKGWKYWTKSDDAVERSWRQLIAAIPDEQKSLLDPALAFYFLDRGKPDRARHHMRQIEFSTSGLKRLEFLRSSSAWGPRVAAMLD